MQWQIQGSSPIIFFMAWPLRCVLGLQTHLLLTEMAQNSFAFCFYPTYVPASPNLENPAWIFSNYDVRAS